MHRNSCKVHQAVLVTHGYRTLGDFGCLRSKRDQFRDLSLECSGPAPFLQELAEHGSDALPQAITLEGPDASRAGEAPGRCSV